ncbi:MAG: hypothetical protein M1828_006656 [Chrysothrix sp. TS-e1954]|nr:MAG: hypothetical protein M1828_006656 [Chrysothrix sp. TS-e1954]
MAFGGAALRFAATFVYALEFCCAAIILGVYSYFLSVLSNHNLPIARQWKAVEGLSGAAVLYTIFAVILTCFLGGISFFAFLAIVLDFCFFGAFIALAILTRHGAGSCSGNVNTPLGSGPANKSNSGYGKNGFGFSSGETVTYFPRLGFACRLNTASFAVSVVGAFLFLISLLLQLAVARHHRKEKAYGPSPANNYTKGRGNRKFWQRKNKNANRDAEMAPIGSGAHDANGKAPNMRTSHETGYTGTTMQTDNQHNSYGAKNDHAGYHTGPTGTSVNPYGYDNTRQTASNF